MRRDKGLFVIKAPGGKSHVSMITNAPDFTPKALLVRISLGAGFWGSSVNSVTTLMTLGHKHN